VDNVCACHPLAPHDCEEHAVPYESDGALGHGFECGICGKFLQAG
jgi:transcription initiation factor IIE alpha subunit